MHKYFSCVPLEDAVVRNPHAPKNLLEIRTAVGDANSEYEMILLLKHVLHQCADRPRVVRARIQILAIRNDDRIRTSRNRVVRELLLLGKRARQGFHSLIVQRRAANMLLVRCHVQNWRVLDERIWNNQARREQI
jgi:hypothetical protein